MCWLMLAVMASTTATAGRHLHQATPSPYESVGLYPWQWHHRAIGTPAAWRRGITGQGEYGLSVAACITQ